MQDYLVNFNRIKRLMPGLSAYQTVVAACRSQPNVLPLPPVLSGPVYSPAGNYKDSPREIPRHRIPPDVAAPTHRAWRPFYFDAPELRKIEQLLDIGGGPGFVASLLKEENPDIKITVFDLPAVCDYALEIFRESGQADDLGAHPGDFFVDPFPSGFEAMQFSHVLELFTPQQVLALLRRAFGALPNGGRLFIYGAAGDGGICTPDWAGQEAYRLYRNAGASHTVRQYRQWLRTVGFSVEACRRNTGDKMFLSAIK